MKKVDYISGTTVFGDWGPKFIENFIDTATAIVGIAYSSSYQVVGMADPGESAPASPTQDDCYIATADGTIFGITGVQENHILHYTGAAWEVLSNKYNDLRTLVEGNQGAQGVQGDIGPQGVQGDIGPQGPQGYQGAYGGPQGPQGYQGAQGSAGAQGATGSQGATGAQGAVGAQGATGSQGATGAQGVQGPQGADSTVQGPQGPQGYQGAQGSAGAQGATGSQGATGAQGAVGAQGAQGYQGTAGGSTAWKGDWSGVTAYIINDAVSHSGSSYICTTGHTNQEPPNATYWNLLAQVGTQGVAGAQGAQGTTGAQGVQGPQGAQGAAGTGSGAIVIACSDEISDLSIGTSKVTFRMPYAMTLSDVDCSVNTAPTGSTIIVDINKNGISILSTKLTIDAGEKTSTTATTPPVISSASLAEDDEITIDIDQVGSTVAGKGLKVILK